MKQFVIQDDGSIGEKNVRERKRRWKFSGIDTDIFEKGIVKCRYASHGCKYAGENNICLLTNEPPEGGCSLERGK
jgi:hypothetical protein